jgi:hypothetical protein
MFDSTSRYAAIPTATIRIPDGAGGFRDVRYVRRRFVPQPDSMRPLAIHTLFQGDRIDNVTNQYLGDPTQFWRVCDANGALNPADLTAEEEIGRSLVIPVPQA